MVGAVLAGLGACASTASPELDSVFALVGGNGFGGPVIPVKPDLRYRYLRVEVEGHPPGMLVLGYIDPHPLGPIEVWYSASREVIKTQNGRIVATAGLKSDWSAVRFSQGPVSWPQVGAQDASYERVRDAVSEYRYAVVEQVQVKSVARVPDDVLVPSLPLAVAQQYQWFRETSRHKGEANLPDAWFAWGKHRGSHDVVYSVQCLTSDFCLHLQRWPVVD